MDLYELFNTPIDELYERGILEDRIERNVKQNTLTFACCLCGQEYCETWARNNPDKLSRGLWCTACKLPTMFLKQAVASTIYYRSHAMEHGNFGENVSGECWYCGKKEGLHFTKFSNGQDVTLCSTHVKPFGKATYEATQRKQAILAGLFDQIRTGTFDAARNYTYDELRVAVVDAGCTLRRSSSAIQIFAQDDHATYFNDQMGINNAVEDMLYNAQEMKKRGMINE